MKSRDEKAIMLAGISAIASYLFTFCQSVHYETTVIIRKYYIFTENDLKDNDSGRVAMFLLFTINQFLFMAFPKGISQEMHGKLMLLLRDEKTISYINNRISGLHSVLENTLHESIGENKLYIGYNELEDQYRRVCINCGRLFQKIINDCVELVNAQ